MQHLAEMGYKDVKGSSDILLWYKNAFISLEKMRHQINFEQVWHIVLSVPVGKYMLKIINNNTWMLT